MGFFSNFKKNTTASTQKIIKEATRKQKLDDIVMECEMDLSVSLRVKILQAQIEAAKLRKAKSEEISSLNLSLEDKKKQILEANRNLYKTKLYSEVMLSSDFEVLQDYLRNIAKLIESYIASLNLNNSQLLGEFLDFIKEMDRLNLEKENEAWKEITIADAKLIKLKEKIIVEEGTIRHAIEHALIEQVQHNKDRAYADITNFVIKELIYNEMIKNVKTKINNEYIRKLEKGEQ